MVLSTIVALIAPVPGRTLRSKTPGASDAAQHQQLGPAGHPDHQRRLPGRTQRTQIQSGLGSQRSLRQGEHHRGIDRVAGDGLGLLAPAVLPEGLRTPRSSQPSRSSPAIRQPQNVVPPGPICQRLEISDRQRALQADDPDRQHSKPIENGNEAGREGVANRDAFLSQVKVPMWAYRWVVPGGAHNFITWHS